MGGCISTHEDDGSITTTDFETSWTTLQGLASLHTVALPLVRLLAEYGSGLHLWQHMDDVIEYIYVFPEYYFGTRLPTLANLKGSTVVPHGLPEYNARDNPPGVLDITSMSQSSNNQPLDTFNVTQRNHYMERIRGCVCPFMRFH